MVIVILFIETEVCDAVIINYISTVTKRWLGLVLTGDVLGGRQVGGVWTCEPQTQDWESMNR